MPAQEIDGSIVTHYIGIDPGVGGGIAYTSPLGDRVMAMPETLHDTRLALNNILDMQQDGRTRCYIEELPKFVRIIPSSTVFVMARNYGQLEGILCTYGIPIVHVRPQVWQGALGLGHKDKSQAPSAWKNKLKSKAQLLFPEEHVTLKTADALLILHAAVNKLI